MFTIPIVPPDLRHEEAIIQAALALDALQKTINSVFERIDTRIARNNEKAQDLEKRITKAQTKIKGLVGTKKAIKIYSSARFPASHVFQDIPLTFRQSMDDSHSMKKEDAPRVQYEVKSRVEPLAMEGLQEKLASYYVRSNETPGTQKTLESAKREINQHKGLGTVPERLKSVNSLLLFNTEERIYTIDNDEDLNSWKRAKMFKVQRQNKLTVAEQKQLMDPAPFSMANKQHSRQRAQTQSGLFYTPRLDEAPEIDLPLDLPDLPGIADDINFEGKEQRQIAPSLFIDLPDLSELEPSKNEVTIKDFSEREKDQLNESMASALPPPPPPLPPPVLITAPTPPPPPPVCSPRDTSSTVSTDLKHEKTISIPSSKNTDHSIAITSTRSDLMDAIRKAGGAHGGRLRAAADVVEKLECSTTKSTATGGDLMADLHNKLLMRRKGISGAQYNEGTATVSQNPVINRLSALIPPPPAARRTINQNTDDDDEEEENDTDWAD